MTYHCPACEGTECRPCNEKAYPTDWTKVRDKLDEALHALSTPTEWHWAMWHTIERLRGQASARISRRQFIHACGYQEAA